MYIENTNLLMERLGNIFVPNLHVIVSLQWKSVTVSVLYRVILLIGTLKPNSICDFSLFSVITDAIIADTDT